MHFQLFWLRLLVHAHVSLLIPDVVLLVPQTPSLVTTVQWTLL